jgi:hydrogenase-4 component F
MNPLYFILGVPIVSAVLFAIIPSYKLAARLNVLASFATFVATLPLFAARPEIGQLFLVDDFNIYLLALTTFVTFTTSIFSARYIPHEVELGRLQPHSVRFYHTMYQAFAFTMLLALSSNNLGVMWVAVEGATLATVFLVGLYRTPSALEASWKYFILCGVGIALGLFGTALLYLAAQQVIGDGLPAMTWSVLIARAGEFQPALLNLAFVFLLVGYGTKAGLAPLHAWLPDAHGDGPTPISALLSGLLLNVALYAILRFKILLTGNAKALAPGPLMIMMGLLSLLLASIMLYRRRAIKHFFAYSSIEHMGIITFAFGMGGPLANFAGLLHMTMHSLIKSGIFYTVGGISQAKGTHEMSKIRGLTTSHPLLGWMLVAGVVAIAGAPPFGVFMSEFLVVSSTFARQPWLVVPLAAGLLLGFGALILQLQGFAFGAPSEETHREQADVILNLQGFGFGTPAEKTHHQRVDILALFPAFVHLLLVLVAGLYLPPVLVSWFQNVARLLG